MVNRWWMAATVLVVAGCGSGPAAPSTTPAPMTTSSTTSTQAPTATTTAPQPPYVAAATWTRTTHGRSLHVIPTAAGRAAGSEQEAAAWREVVAKAPDANTVSMQRQFVCHWRYAKGKATWNLEPWRPAVSLDEVIAAYCNPGGPE